MESTTSLSVLKRDEAELSEMVGPINEAHGAYEKAARLKREKAIECGRLLLQAKSRLGHGGFLKWVNEHLSFGPRAAQRYMKAAITSLSNPKCDNVSHLPDPASSLRDDADQVADASNFVRSHPRSPKKCGRYPARSPLTGPSENDDVHQQSPNSLEPNPEDDGEPSLRKPEESASASVPPTPATLLLTQEIDRFIEELINRYPENLHSILALTLLRWSEELLETAAVAR